MANYLPVLLVSVSAGLMPDDASLQPLPRGQVDYLSHDWAQEEDVWRSWRSMTKNKNEIANGVRLENASWRTWWKQRNKLSTISPETLNWLKDSDVTWLYGPLHTAVDWTPPPGPRPPLSSPARSHSNTPSPPARPSSSNAKPAKPSALKKSPSMSSPSSSVALCDAYANHPQARPYGPGYSYGYLPSSTATTPGSAGSNVGMKPILKHRSISEMLTGALPAVLDGSSSSTAFNASNSSNFPINPISYPPPIIDEDLLDAEAEANAHPVPPGSSSSSYFPPNSRADSNARPKMLHTRSDTNVLRRLAHRERQLRPPRVAVAAASQHDQPDPPPYSYVSSPTPSTTPPPRSFTSPSSSSSSGSSAPPLTPSSRTSEYESISTSSSIQSPSDSRNASPYYPYNSQTLSFSQATGQPTQVPQKKHISFNAIVEQCISIDSDADSPSTINNLNTPSLSVYGRQNDYLDSSDGDKYSARRIWEEYGDADVGHFQFVSDPQDVEADNGYDEDEDNIAGDLFAVVRDRANLSEAAHTGSPPLPLSDSQAQGPIVRPPSPEETFLTGNSTQAGNSKQSSAGQQTYSRRSILFRDEDEDEDEDDDDVIEIKTPSRRSSSSSLSSGGKLSPSSAKYQLPAESPNEPSQQHNASVVVSRTSNSQVVQGTPGNNSPAIVEDRAPVEHIPVARKMKSRRGTYTSGSGSGSNSGSGSRSRSANGPRYTGYNSGYSSFGLYAGTAGPAEHMTIAPIAPTVLKAGGRSGSGDSGDEGDEDEEREVQELGRELEKLGEGAKKAGGVFYVGGGYPYGSNLPSSVHGKHGGYSNVGGGNGYGGGTYGFDGYGNYHLDEDEEIMEPIQRGLDDGHQVDDESHMPTFLSKPLVRSPSPNLEAISETASGERVDAPSSHPHMNFLTGDAPDAAVGRNEESISVLQASSLEPKENPRIASLKSSEAFFYPQQQRDRESSTSPSPTSSSITSATASTATTSPRSSPNTSTNTSERRGTKFAEEDSLLLPPPSLAIPTLAVGSSHSTYPHADGFSDSHARRFLSPPDATSLSPSSRTSSPSVARSYSSNDNVDTVPGPSSPRGRSLTRHQRPGSLGGSGGSIDPEPERGRSRSRSTATSSITSGANSPTLSDSGGSCYNTSSSPSARWQNGILGIGSSYGAAVYGGIGGMASHSGREVRDGKGTRIYRKTSEEFFHSSGGSSAERDADRGRNVYGGDYRVVRAPRGSESLSPVGGSHATSSYTSNHVRQAGDEHRAPRSIRRQGSKDGLPYKSYSVNSFGTGSHAKEDGGLSHSLPVVEESADERTLPSINSVPEPSSSSVTNRTSPIGIVPPQRRTLSSNVASSRPRTPPSVNVASRQEQDSVQRESVEPLPLDSSLEAGHGTIVGKAADFLSTTRGILGVFWSS